MPGAQLDYVNFFYHYQTDYNLNIGMECQGRYVFYIP